MLCKVVCKITLNTNISGTAQVLKLKFWGLISFIETDVYTKFQQNLTGLPGELLKI